MTNGQDGAVISSLRGREILDSRGNPTVEAEIHLTGGATAIAAAPSGASTGTREAVELRDGDKRLAGKGVRRAVSHINNDIAAAIIGADASQQGDIDATLISLDGSKDKSRLGANALLAVSLATAKAAAIHAGVPLHVHLGGGNTMPVPMMNILNGGAHAANNLDIQEFMIMPLGFNDFASALFAGTEVFHVLRRLLLSRGDTTAVGDEGGFAPNLRGGTTEALDLLTEAITRAGYTPGCDIAIAMDCAASEFYRDGVYVLKTENFRGDAAMLVELLARWANTYPIVSIEDACAEDDWDGWKILSERLADKLQLVGDDLFVTNCALLQRGIDQQIGTALLAKPNQAGTVTETQQAVRLAQQAGYGVVLSHRSGETEFSEIADMAVAYDAGQIKTGAPCRGERVAKYNRLLRIADELTVTAPYRGVATLARQP
ncbi:phosphopyruvate hydratase [Candidatus Persebacteraceae bacterium Df01]|uniref:Enolase n=1 Tax=Candidatus Doriopsillibacter californiensis TaxID=2970740 RepID=A0ABT7QNA6_9GAMM|nr:phosphopyruvate hydratase [Candidatus Persebacteraceae bacterium Df01]